MPQSFPNPSSSVRSEWFSGSQAISRVESVDLLRGVAMIVMALDHTRDFLGVPGVSPTDLNRASLALFLTRWITNFCAPVFFLLTGTGACLSLQRKSKRDLSRYLLVRGTWLIFLEIVVLRCLAFQFNFDYRVTLLMVIWALGWSMIALACLIYLPTWGIVAFGVVTIAGHNLLDSVNAASFGKLAPLWMVLHRQGAVLQSPLHVVFVAYPLVPWIGVTAVGYGLGQIYCWSPERRGRVLLRLGIGLTAAFAVLRAMNVYGDPNPWAMQKSAVFTVLSFLNVTKYPPSFLFLLMTLGPALLFLRAVDRSTPRLLRPALIFGRVPLFYYQLHLILIHLIATAICYISYRHIHWMFESPTLGQYPVTAPPGWGFRLPAVYLVCVLVVTSLYPICKWFAGVKRRSSGSWLSYF